jgi:uncharacterized protein
MNLIQNTIDTFTVYAFQEGKIVISVEPTTQKKEYTRSLILLPDQTQDWSIARFAELTQAHFTKLLAFEPEVILLGTGRHLIFPAKEMLTDIYAARIGIEVMSTEAACRTYNILSSDGRRVLAALII